MLKGEQGFVGYRANSLKMECNKANYETIKVERGEQGQVFFRGEGRVGIALCFSNILQSVSSKYITILLLNPCRSVFL